MELGKKLSEGQKGKLRELLSDSIHNKEHLHPSEYQRATVTLFRANQLGYTSIDIEDLLKKSEDHYSDDTIDSLQGISDTISDLVHGLNNYENERLKNFEL